MFAKILLLSLVAVTANAQIAGLSSYSGNGCPQGSIASTQTDDGSIISILFDSFKAETAANKNYALSTCLMNIAVDVPEGYRIAKADAVQNGFYSVPKGSWGRMMTELYLRGAGGRMVMQTYNYRDFHNDFMDNVTLETSAEAKADNNCSERRQNLQIRSSISLWTARNQTQYAGGVIDSVDLTLSSLTPSMYSVVFEKCKVKPQPPRRPPFPRFPWNRYQEQ